MSFGRTSHTASIYLHLHEGETLSSTEMQDYFFVQNILIKSNQEARELFPPHKLLFTIQILERNDLCHAGVQQYFVFKILSTCFTALVLFVQPQAICITEQKHKHYLMKRHP